MVYVSLLDSYTLNVLIMLVQSYCFLLFYMRHPVYGCHKRWIWMDLDQILFIVPQGEIWFGYKVLAAATVTVTVTNNTTCTHTQTSI